MTSDEEDDNGWWTDDKDGDGHGALSVMRGFSRSDAHAARLPTTASTAGSERR